MSLPRRIFYNTLAQSFGKIFAAALGLVSIALLSQYLEERGFGQYSTVVAFLGLFAVLADFGLYLYTLREISKPETNGGEILSNALGLRLVLAAASLVIGAFVALAFSYEPVVKQAMFVGVAAFLFVSLNQVFIGVFQKHLAQHLVVLSETFGRVINLVLVYIFIQQELSLPYFILALIFANAATFFLTFFLARRFEKFGIAFDIKVWKKILHASWPLVFAVIFNLLYFKTDTVILSLFQSEEAVGIYSLPYKLLEGFIAFPAMFVGLIMPLLSKAAFRDWPEFKNIMQRSFDVILIMAVFVVVAALFFAEPVISLVKNVGGVVTAAGVSNLAADYSDSPAVFRILILSVATIFIGTLFGYAVVAVNQQKAMVKGYLLGAVVGLTSYFILIPRYSYWGAAWSTLLTEVLVSGFAFYLVSKASKHLVSLKILFAALPAIAILVIFFRFVSVYWILEIALGILVYAVSLVVFKAVPRQFVKELFFRK